MIGVLGLVVFAVAADTAARRWLVQARWPARSPVLGIWAWQGVTFAIAASLVLTGFVLLLPQLHLSIDLAAFVRTCVAELRHQYGTPAGAGLALAGGVLSTLLVVRFTWSFAYVQVMDRRRRRRMLQHLRLVGRRSKVRGSGISFVEIEHPVAHVYCLPGRHGEVVVTSAARAQLTARQLQGVLAHERAHLYARHHIALGAAHALTRTFGWLPVFAVAAERIADLAEMQADDAAASIPRRQLASALFRLTTASAPQGAMGAGGASTVRRIQRLVVPAAPLPPTMLASIFSATLALLLVPALLALLPTALALLLDCCRAVVWR